MHSSHISSGAKCVHTTIQSTPFASTMLCPTNSVNHLRSCPSIMWNASARRSLPTLPPSSITRLHPIQTIRHTSNIAGTTRSTNNNNKIMWLYQLPPSSNTNSTPSAPSPFTAANPNTLFGISHSLPTLHATEILPPAASESIATTPAAHEALESEVDDELASASMSAFAKMEAQMRANKKKQQQEENVPIGEPVTLQAESLESVGTKVPLGMSNSWSIKFPLQKPLEPTAGMCCGRDCPNCVWIQYSNALSDYEDEQKQLGFPDVKFTQGPQVDTLLNAKRGLFEDQEPRAPVSDIDPIPSPSIDRGTPLSPFERAMRRERDQLRSVIKPQGKRSLGTIILPKERDESKRDE